MIRLYKTTYCPYCRVVAKGLEKLTLEEGKHYRWINIEDSDEAREELIELGGKRQVPYMYDEEKKFGMYESADIVKYLQKNEKDILSR
jgi:glutaredoxin 3